MADAGWPCTVPMVIRNPGNGYGIQIMQTANPCCWKWVVFLDATRMQTGIALTRADAVLDAEAAIDKAYQQRLGELRSRSDT